MGMIYISTIEYSDLLLSSKYKRLLIANPTRDPQTIADQTYAYKEALNNIVLQT